MTSRLLKLRFRRRLKQRREQFSKFNSQVELGFERYFLKRLDRFKGVRRFVLGWTALLFLLAGGVVLQAFNLSNYYQTVQAVAGGTYREGVLGTFTTANPLYATNEVDSTITRLLFNGLLTYDETNTLVGDLAESYDVADNGTSYIIKLKPNLRWHDGKPLTSADVLYTYQSIQNPDAQSPLKSSWDGITVGAPNPQTVTFTLPGPLASFANTLTNGIVPKHRLEKTPANQLRTAEFNTINPVGSGPFKWQAIEVTGTDPSIAEEQIALLPFDQYHNGKPQLERFIVHAFANRDKLIKEFESGALTSLAGLTSAPEAVKDKANVSERNILLTAGTYAFFKTSNPILASQKVRQALVQSANTVDIIKQLAYATKPVTGPILDGQLANDPTFAQPSTDPAAAAAALDADGWKVGATGLRIKDNTPLAFNLVASDTPEYRLVAKNLKQQWEALGAKVEVRLLGAQGFQNSLASHEYDVILYGISIGTDPDVYVYWDSAQADIRSANRLNLSEYKNKVADEALESGRTRLDPALRTVKYRPFLQAWQQDLPALGLYQPRVLYLTNGNVTNFVDSTGNTSTDRFRNVHEWMIREAKVTNPRPADQP